MSISVDIDTGGTFTDAFVSDGQVAELIKVETTPHDLTVCFLNVFEQAAERFGMPERELLARTDVVRYSTTVGTNMLIERRGPRLGLIVAEGAEADLYRTGDDNSGPTLLAEGFVEPDMIRTVALKSKDGHTTLASDPLEVRRAIAELLDAGARSLVVALPGADHDPTAERALHAIARDAYPRYLLGAVPVLLASEVSAVTDDHRRLATALLNAYLHPTMVRYLYRAEELLRERGYRRPLLVVHSSGGATRVAKTMAIETYNSGPVSGLHGAKAKAAGDGENFVITMDIGGTSTDIGFVLDGKVSSPTGAVIEGIPVATEACELRAIGGGGGSIASVGEDGELRVGPRSAGALPGPASYGLGGEAPTVTDANLVLGLLSAERFFAGGRTLDLKAGRDAIERDVAEPLGIDVEQAARRIRATLERFIADSMAAYTESKGMAVSDAALVSFGGAGGLHAAAVAELIGIRRVYCYREAPVFSAFGVATMDVVHRYEASVAPIASDEEIAAAVERLIAEARRDMHGEGFDFDKVVGRFSAIDPASSQVLEVPGERPSADAVRAAARSLGDSGYVLLELRATATIERDLSTLKTGDQLPAGADAPPARTVTVSGQAQDVPTYEWRGTPSGEKVRGPGLVDAPFTTVWVPAGWTFTRSDADAIILERGAAE